MEVKGSEAQGHEVLKTPCQAILSAMGIFRHQLTRKQTAVPRPLRGEGKREGLEGRVQSGSDRQQSSQLISSCRTVVKELDLWAQFGGILRCTEFIFRGEGS